jgi:N-methylhydantoinase A/oxoprolinase/acetone carboxylase beta subunit
MWTVDIDVGGTLTDGIFTEGDRVLCAKVDTTPHDLTVCLLDCLNQGASQLGFPDAAAFLENVELIRWSTTITSNVLAELRGPRIGVLVSKGHEKDLYGNKASSLVLNRLVAARDVIGVNGTAGEAEIMNAARSLLESGVRRICVCLKDSHRDPSREISLKHVIENQYPDHFLGSVPVLAGSDISKSSDDQTRAFCAVINAYTHGALATTLFKAEDDLRGSNYLGAFLVSHVNGGVAGIGKTKAIDTIESGPILGVYGSSFLAKAYGVNDVVVLDVGGTTAKVGVLHNAEPIEAKPSDFFGIPVEISLPFLRSIALGGGSVVKPLAAGSGASAIQLGPESMGSYPGPACYNMGGDQPTLTDALVAAGLINPDYFLGGAKLLDLELARKAIQESVASPLNISLEDACKAIIDRAFEMVAGLISSARAGLPKSAANPALFAYGGNGGLFACGVAEKAGLEKIQVFSLGPVFSAFGSSVADISHVYERSVPAEITDSALPQIRRTVEEMKNESTQDLLGEGIKPENVTYTLEFDVVSRGRRSVPVACPESALHGAKDLLAALRRSSAGGSSQAPSLELVRLRVRKAMAKPHLSERALQAPDSSHALLGKRRVLWGSAGEAQIYRWESLQPGNRVAGPAVLEGATTTYFIPEGWTLAMDRFGNAAVNRD